MSEHLTFDEIVSFISASVNGDELNELAFRINEHISKCDDCYRLYKSLLEVDEYIEMIKLNEISDEKYALIEALLLGSEPSLSDRAKKWIEKLCVNTAEIAFKIVSNACITAVDARLNDDIYAFDFGNPIPLGARSGGTVSGNATTLVDNENGSNRIELAEGGTLRVELDPTSYSTNPLACLVSQAGKSYVSEMNGSAEVICCEFKDVPNGEYRLYIE